MMDSPSVTCPSPAMTTLLSRRTQRTVVERILRGAGASVAILVAVATWGFFFMSAIFDYSSGGRRSLTAGDRGVTGPPYSSHRVLLAEFAKVYHSVYREDRRARAHGGRWR